MKVIYNSTIISAELVGGTENAEYPLENVLNEWPRKPFRATGTYAKIRVVESGEAEVFALFATNAKTVTIKSVEEDSIEFGVDQAGNTIEAGVDENGNAIELADRGEQSDPVYAIYTKKAENNGFILLEVEPLGEQRTLDITLNSQGVAPQLQVGIIDAGEIMHLRDMERESYQESPRDASFKQELQSGNPYYIDLGRSRDIPFYTIMYAGDGDDPDGFTTWWDFYWKYIVAWGQRPRTWLLSENLDVSNYGIWGGLDDMPKTVMTSREHMIVATKIREIT